MPHLITFLRKEIQSKKYSLRNTIRATNFKTLCHLADKQTFDKIPDNPDHVLHCLLPLI